MKKAIALILSLVLIAIVFSACGSSGEGDESSIASDGSNPSDVSNPSDASGSGSDASGGSSSSGTSSDSTAADASVSSPSSGGTGDTPASMPDGFEGTTPIPETPINLDVEKFLNTKVECFDIDKDYVYYGLKEGGLYRAKHDGSDVKKLSNEDVGDIEVQSDGRIKFMNGTYVEGQTNNIYYINRDGTNKTAGNDWVEFFISEVEVNGKIYYFYQGEDGHDVDFVGLYSRDKSENDLWKGTPLFAGFIYNFAAVDNCIVLVALTNEGPVLVRIGLDGSNPVKILKADTYGTHVKRFGDHLYFVNDKDKYVYRLNINAIKS